MFTLTITQENNANIIRLVFKTKEVADSAYGALKMEGTEIEITDDYGHRVSVRSWASVMLEDYVGGLTANQDLQLLQAHGQIKFNKRCEQDSVLMDAARAQQMRGSIVNPSALMNGSSPFPRQ